MGVVLDSSLPFDEILRVLDDLHRSELDLVASQRCIQAMYNQIRVLRREWKQTIKPSHTREIDSQ